MLQGNDRQIALTWLILALVALAACAQQRGLHIMRCNALPFYPSLRCYCR
jgi:hypothetical protein